MPLSEDIISGSYSIQAYESGQLTINQKTYSDSLVLSASDIISPWPVTSIEQLSSDHFECVLDLKPDVVLLGTGDKQAFPAMEMMGFFAHHNLGVEAMNTGALCRTFNILVAEDRNVVAAIIQSSAG